MEHITTPEQDEIFKTLPRDSRTYTPEQREAVIAFFAAKPIEEMRRYQDVAQYQAGVCREKIASGDTLVRERHELELAIIEDHQDMYFLAIMRQLAAK